ncbi:MAG TPA: cytochrome c oxidase accessory protein CcoG [Oligoflexia bacterium]|nr:cytochrome c oxidase accessory protein CcoG [Oligoflexia bacterium]HMR24245.1 cytochrome c oxidase accessory protein CcoG [Oligoflexia bacterium]
MQSPEYTHKSSIQKDGSRPKIRLADVKGFFTRFKNVTFPLIIVIFFVIPLLKFGGERFLLLQVDQRVFNIAGFVFNAQDVYLIFFIVTGLAFSLFFITALFGRVWCGYLCPQTVILEGVYRKIERWIEGPKNQQLILEKSAWNKEKIMKKGLKYFLYALVSLLFAFGFISYFVPHSYYIELWQHGPSTHPTVFLWGLILSFIFYGNFAWFREQLCLIICPYGRLQSALTDDDTFVIGYDEKRGEPRGKLKDENRGACIDCARCVVVCPTGIDIRQGMQMECIGCANCIDACDEIMEKTNQLKGLIRYDSYNGFNGEKTKLLRPRIYVYMVLLLIGFLVFSVFLRNRQNFEANLLRLSGRPYTFDAGQIRNAFEIHLINKSAQEQRYTISVESEQKQLESIMPFKSITLKKNEDKRIPLFLILNKDMYKEDFEVSVKIHVDEIEKQIPIKFLGP